MFAQNALRNLAAFFFFPITGSCWGDANDLQANQPVGTKRHFGALDRHPYRLRQVLSLSLALLLFIFFQIGFAVCSVHSLSQDDSNSRSLTAHIILLLLNSSSMFTHSFGSPSSSSSSIRPVELISSLPELTKRSGPAHTDLRSRRSSSFARNHPFVDSDHTRRRFLGIVIINQLPLLSTILNLIPREKRTNFVTIAIAINAYNTQPLSNLVDQMRLDF